MTVYFTGKFKHAIDIRIPDRFKNKVCGLCGDWDGTKNNDWLIGPDTTCGSDRETREEGKQVTLFSTLMLVSTWLQYIMQGLE